MWYKYALNVNLFGLPVMDRQYKTEKQKKRERQRKKLLQQLQYEENLTPEEAIEAVEEQLPVTPEENDPEAPIDESDLDVTDPTPETEFTPEDLQSNIQQIEFDPTSLIDFEKRHDNCRCTMEQFPIFNMGKMIEVKRVWKYNDTACEECIRTGDFFNESEIKRLLNKGIPRNLIP
mgnify:FL=1|jgi:hypothetical protein